MSRSEFFSLRNLQGCCLLFNYQGSFFVFVCLSRVSLNIISCVSLVCQDVFLTFFDFFQHLFPHSTYACFPAYKPQDLGPPDKRRKRDLNPRAAINDLLPFQGSPFGQLGYFSKSARFFHIKNYQLTGW